MQQAELLGHLPWAQESFIMAKKKANSCLSGMQLNEPRRCCCVQCGQQLKTLSSHVFVSGERKDSDSDSDAETGNPRVEAGNSSALNKQTPHTSSLISRGRILCSRTRSSGVNGQ